MLNTEGENAFNFGLAAAPRFFFGASGRNMSSIMTDQERIRHIQEASKKFVSRNKCVDASLQTMINQARASSVAVPVESIQAVTSKQVLQTTQPGVLTSGCTTSKIYITGVGTGNDYSGILQKAQACAICPNTGPADTGVIRQIVLPVPCIDMTQPPFAQQDTTNFYKEPCTDPGKRDYFPRKIYDGPGCTYTRITTPSG